MPKISPVHYRILVTFFEGNGFHLLRTRGDHLIYSKEDIKRPVVIPMYKDVPIFIIKNNLRTAGIDREVYLDFLSRL